MTQHSDPVWLFTYGTLRQPAVQRAVFGREIVEVADELAGFEVHTITLPDPDGATAAYPILRPARDPAQEVAGAVLPVGPEDLVRADAYEGEAYLRISVTLASGRTAFVYVAASEA